MFEFYTFAILEVSFEKTFIIKQDFCIIIYRVDIGFKFEMYKSIVFWKFMY